MQLEVLPSQAIYKLHTALLETEGAISWMVESPRIGMLVERHHTSRLMKEASGTIINKTL
jgi:hypothetical protein